MPCAGIIVACVRDGVVGLISPVAQIDTAQVGVAQRPLARRRAFEVDLVHLARHQIHRKPVAVTFRLDVTGGRAADADGARAGRGLSVVIVVVSGGDAHGNGIRTRPAWVVDLDVIRPGGVRGKCRKTGVETHATVVVSRKGDPVARAVEDGQGRVVQRAAVIARAVALDFNVVKRAGFEGDGEPVAVAVIFQLARGGTADGHGAAGAGGRRVIVGNLGHRQPVGPCRRAASARRNVVGTRCLCRVLDAAVGAHTAIVVTGTRNQVSMLVAPIAQVDTAQVGVFQGPLARRRAFEVDPVHLARHQLHRKPVAVVFCLDDAGGGAAYGHRARAHRGLGVVVLRG